ncbi:unnamed protein product [Litomosoides sigmodontis]|uniref:Uncharacterized protein n=1 Tax=Litomosoides sigmodontis TaxID=42156 RepID=A0A3P6T659_LITSI|nr:unnamed protein product [Litomosoides sigmodontis]
MRKKYASRNFTLSEAEDFFKELKCLPCWNVRNDALIILSINKGFCQLYATNSNSSDSNITLDNSLKPISAVLEILDKCPATNTSANSEDDRLAAIIKLKLKQKLESLSDPELLTSPLQVKATERFKYDGLTRTSTSSANLSDKKMIHRTDHFTDRNVQLKLWDNAGGRQTKNAEYEPVRPVSGGSLMSAVQDGSNPSSSLYNNKHPQHANHYSSNLPQISNTNNNYLPTKQDYYSPTTNQVPFLTPIKPAVVNYGQRGAIYNRCSGGNCYAPSLAYLQKSTYNWPCTAPCELNPCFTTCPQVATASPNLMFNKEWPGSYINEQQEANVTSKPEDVSQRPIQSMPTTTVEHSPESITISWSEWTPQSESTREELCSSGPCPEWEPWSAWSECSRKCGGGQRLRSRICPGGRKCDGPSMSVESCSTENCGQWSIWGDWGECSVTCGFGQQTKRRQCMGSDLCIGENFENKVCEAASCPSWSAWEPWGTCSVSCGSGHRHRTRICHGGNDCVGDAEEREACRTNSCPEWTDWSPWTQCTETCGTNGSKLRVRTCVRNNLISSLCDGAAQDQMICKGLPECPSWTSWSSWSVCSTTCGHGQESRQRSCLPTGTQCAGAEQEFRFCQKSVCPYWDEWSSWSTCSVTCGVGIRERRRNCIKADVTKTKEDSPVEDIARIKPEVESTKPEVIPVYKTVLPVDDQGDVKTSSNTSQNNNSVLASTMSTVTGNISTVRLIQDNSCSGNSVDRGQCYAGLCCKLTEWTTWSSCSVTCDGGIRERLRFCSPEIGGPQSYGFYESLNYPKMIRKRISEESTMQHRPNPAVVGHYTRLNYGLQRVIPPEFRRLTRRHQRAAYIHNFAPFKQNNFVQRGDSVCRCDGELREEESCAQTPCPQMSNAPECCWSHWTEWCSCTGACTQGNRMHTRYCMDGTSANGRTSNSNIERNPCIPLECPVGQELPQLSATAQNRTQTDFYNFSQYNCRQTTTTRRDVDVKCLWTSWNSDTYYIPNIRTRRRSCMAFPTAKVKRNCDGKIVEQVECFCPQMSVGTSPPLRGAEVTAYRGTSNTSSCSWSQWGRWSACSETCGAGKIVRKRSCPCRSCSYGEPVQVESCELKSC